jgi:hypothetical protein
MPLPKITTPTYELELPSTEKSIRYRPFLVKEEKLLVIALKVKIQNKSRMQSKQSSKIVFLPKILK